MNNHLCLFITIDKILILSNRDFREIRILFLGSNAIIEEGKDAVFVTEKLSDGETSKFWFLYIQILHPLEMVGNGVV